MDHGLLLPEKDAVCGEKLIENSNCDAGVSVTLSAWWEPSNAGFKAPGIASVSRIVEIEGKPSASARVIDQEVQVRKS